MCMPIISHAHPHSVIPHLTHPLSFPPPFLSLAPPPTSVLPPAQDAALEAVVFFYSTPASPMHFALCVMPSPSTFTAASSSTGAGFESSARLACYGNSAAATSTMMSADELFLKRPDPADEALHAPMKAAATGSTPTPGCCG
ncbi:hypothetical protein VitviT2T_005066 [Vitis vinifera]|uniref:Uncharacterized protein n=1 Tax=Vitis vinifera TaxID=29760 RepID=A0ABY9BSL1_VITVI|nr:hypothetical protein VitviT2T_005066 [Vitis vinifera]